MDTQIFIPLLEKALGEVSSHLVRLAAARAPRKYCALQDLDDLNQLLVLFRHPYGTGSFILFGFFSLSYKFRHIACLNIN